MTDHSPNTRFAVCSYGSKACLETAMALQNKGWTLVASVGLTGDLRKGSAGMDAFWNAAEPDIFEATFNVKTVPVMPTWMAGEDLYCLLQTFDRHTIDAPISVDERLERGLRLVDGWGKVLDEQKPALCLFDDAPHNAYDYALYLVARARGVRTFMFQYGPSVHHMVVTDRVGGQALAPHRSAVDVAAIQGCIGHMGQSGASPGYMERQREEAASFRRRHSVPALLANSLREKLRLARGWKIAPAGWSLLSYGKRPFGWTQRNLMPWQLAWMMRSVQKRNRALQKRYQEATSSTLPECFVYVPLHYQPEATTMPLAGWWSNQVALLQTLAAQLPTGWSIVTKEHPTTFHPHLFGYQGRRSGYYKDIGAIPGVHIAQETTPSHILMQNAQFVLTLRGTASWEAINMGRWGFFTSPNWFTLHPGLMVAPETAIMECLKRIEAPPPGGRAVLESVAPFLIPNDRIGHTDMAHTAAIVAQTLLSAMSHPPIH